MAQFQRNIDSQIISRVQGHAMHRGCESGTGYFYFVFIRVEALDAIQALLRLFDFTFRSGLRLPDCDAGVTDSSACRIGDGPTDRSEWRLPESPIQSDRERNGDNQQHPTD